MNQLFKKTGNNNFQLLTENTIQQPKTNEVIQLNSGLKKIFCEGVSEISYNRVQNMGFGFIADIHAAKAVALEESRIIAEEFGYRDDVDNKKFIKEDGEMSDYDKSNSENEPAHAPAWGDEELATGGNVGWSDKHEEKREVQIGKEILKLAELIKNKLSNHQLGHDGLDIIGSADHIIEFATQLIKMHGAK